MGCLEESKPDPVLDGHLSPTELLTSRSASFLKWTGALYPGLGEQRRRPCLRLQQVGVTAFHPASCDTGYVSVALSMRPSLAKERTAPGLRRAPCSMLSGLSSPLLSDRTRAAVLPPGKRKYTILGTLSRLFAPKMGILPKMCAGR